MKLKITPPPVVVIGISGPVGVGKSIIMHRIKQVLIEEFGATVAINSELQGDFNSANYDSLQDWQCQQVKDTLWFLTE